MFDGKKKKGGAGEFVPPLSLITLFKHKGGRKSGNEEVIGASQKRKIKASGP